MPPTLARYEILGGLASGGMADVWLARIRGPAGFEKVAVVKTILPHLARDPAFTEMFLSEARVAAMLNHPNCVQIFDLGQEDSTYFLAMEFIDGFSLARVLRRAAQKQRPLAVSHLARIAVDAASGLDYAHRLIGTSGEPLSLVHRDVSPDNLLTSFSGLTKVVDFGIARAALPRGRAAFTESGQVKGKVGYMAPEYLRGEPIDGRADLFALGVVLYRALTGHKPFEGPTDALTIKAILDHDPPPLRSLNAEVPEAIEAMVMRALAKDAAGRFESAREMRQAIESSMGRPAEHHEVASYLESLWPPDDDERDRVRALARGEVSDPSHAILDEVVSDQVPSVASVFTRPDRSTRRMARSVGQAVPLAALGLIVVAGVAAVGLLWRSVSSQAPTSAGVGRDPAAPPPVPAARPALAAAPELPPSPAPAKPAPRPPPGSGRIRVEVVARPPGELYVDGRLIGRAPGSFELSPGLRTLRVADRGEGLDREVVVTVARDGERRIEIVSGKAFLDLRASPWAAVRLDGRELGITPVPVQEVWEGRHEVEMSNPELGRSRRTVVEIKAGERRTVREVLDAPAR